MFKVRQIFNILFIVLLVFLPIGKNPAVNYIDEIMFGLLGLFAVMDCIVNRKWKSYSLFWTLLAGDVVYLAYTLIFKHYNLTSNVLMDAVIELKPFVAFVVIYGAGMSWDYIDKRTIRITSATIVTINCIILMGGYRVQTLVSGHPAEVGMTQFISTMLFILTSLDKNCRLSKRDTFLVVIWLCFGLLCGRSKYYAELVLAIFFLFIYRPGVLKHFSLKHGLILTALCIIVIAVVWKKFSYYYITGNSGTFDPNVAASYARPVLYATSFLILIDYFPMGSGFASFATYASETNYSTLYYEYGLDKIWGLSPSYSSFICDAFYPSLAQFGFMGLVLFIAFWRYIYIKIRFFIRMPDKSYSVYFKVGTLFILFILIESTSGNAFTTPPGFITMLTLGMLCRKAQNMVNTKSEEIVKQTSYSETKRIKI